MTDKKISQLTSATAPLNATDELAVVQGGVTKKVTAKNLTFDRGVEASSLIMTGAPASGTLNIYRTASNANFSAIQFRNTTNTAAHGQIGYNSNELRLQGVNIVRMISGAGDSMVADASRNVTVSAGNLVIGTAGKGIDFSADPSAAGMTSELLDDYEEGTWTPSLVCSTSGTITLTNPANSMIYTKVGRVVTLSGRLLVDSVASPVGDLRLTGIPYTIFGANGGFSAGAVFVYNALVTSAHSSVQLSINQADTQMYIRGYLNGAQVTTFANNIQAGTGIQLFAQYTVV